MNKPTPIDCLKDTVKTLATDIISATDGWHETAGQLHGVICQLSEDITAVLDLYEKEVEKLRTALNAAGQLERLMHSMESNAGDFDWAINEIKDALDPPFEDPK